MSLIRMTLTVAASLAALGGAALAAEPAAPSAPPSAAAQGLARALFPKEAWTAATQQISMLVQRNLEGHPGSKLEYPSDLPTRIRTEVEAVLPYDDFVNMHAKELAANLGEPEMKELTSFYGTPLGKKWLQAQPKVTDAVNFATQHRLQAKMPEVMQKLAKLAKAPEPAKDAPAKKDAPKKSAAPKKEAAPRKDAPAAKEATPVKPDGK